MSHTTYKNLKLVKELSKVYERDALLKKVWRSEGSYYDVETKRIVVQDDHELNFISVESKKSNNIIMELEMGCHA